MKAKLGCALAAAVLAAAPNASVGIGFQVSSFTLNGSACTVG